MVGGRPISPDHVKRVIHTRALMRTVQAKGVPNISDVAQRTTVRSTLARLRIQTVLLARPEFRPRKRTHKQDL